jgi:hypothetical protein
MSRLATIELDGRRYLWREIIERRRRQIAAHDAAQARQLTLFDLKDDTRPATQRTAAGRYAEPTLFAALDRPRT